MIILNDRTIQADLVKIFKDELEIIGLDVSDITSVHDVFYSYFVMHKRLISTRKRVVHYSNGFVCPAASQGALGLLVGKIEEGMNLNPYLSKKMRDVSYQDKMLFDWDVYHLHLGLNEDNDGYIHRTGALLFAMFDDDNAYLINIYNHKDHWTNKDVLNIVNESWPYLLERYKINAEPECDFSNEELKHIRKANVNTILKLNDGTCIYAPGLGLMTSGHSMWAMTQVTDIMHDIINVRKNIIDWVIAHPELDGYDEMRLQRAGNQINCLLPYHKIAFPWMRMQSLIDKING